MMVIPAAFIRLLFSDVENSLHLTARQQYRINDSIKDAFIFSDGLIISWNMDQAEMEQIADFLQPFEIDSYSASLTNEETESMAFTYGTG
jgi:uncharacterized Rmd1/YagE family protein